MYLETVYLGHFVNFLGSQVDYLSIMFYLHVTAISVFIVDQILLNISKSQLDTSVMRQDVVLVREGRG